MTLIERIEAASGPDRELDRLIQRLASNAPDAHWFLCYTGAYVTDDLAAEYTASIDAALTLVPEKWRLRQMNFSGPCADDRKWHLNLHGGNVGQDTFVGRGKTACLALCAAALRAREANHV